jgi:ribosome recycling factor
MPKYLILPGNEILERYKKHLSGIRSGRVNSSILESMTVEAYGSKMHFNEIATITIPEPVQLLITPFDKSLISNIVKAINDSNLGVNPQDDGVGVRLMFPPLTEETKKLRVKDLHKLREEARIEVRLKRQDALKDAKDEKEQGISSEDDLKSFEDNLQKEVDNLNSEIEEITKNKEDEVMKI